jgi:hypothetical protein
MGSLSWVRIARRVPGVVRQREFANLETLMEAEASRQPARNLFILSCAIPAGIGTFGGLSVFVAWISGNKGLPLLLGTLLTAVLAAGAWFIFYRLYQAIPPAKRHLRDLIMKFSQRYGSFGNIILGERPLSDPFMTLLDEAAGIYLQYCTEKDNSSSEAPTKAINAIEAGMSKLMEVALQKDKAVQDESVSWAKPLIEEMRLLNKTLVEHALASQRDEIADPLAKLRDARADLQSNTSAIHELDQHLRIR